ncbi:expressed unknown protein [Seminavis robusta]|uniref:BZIP domain-containing protein n=1 Tax=Seminavis robusta TaxID=568900 RepID=A0A9N8HAT6_9STRA|nr:expressed unknown protein [Seminavis robusta]|eukprot:Sro160_g072010.1 n/a (519) ;mRNA; f:7458-9153
MISSGVAPAPLAESENVPQVSGLLDGDLGADELNEIPSLLLDDCQFEPDMSEVVSLLSEQHPATQIALTASAIDGALGCFEFLPEQVESAPAASIATQEITVQPTTVSVTGTDFASIVSDDSGMISDDSDDSGDSANPGKRRSVNKKNSQASKKRRIDAQSSPVASPRLTSVAPLAVVSPILSSLSGMEQAMLADPTQENSLVEIPELPDCNTATDVNNKVQPLLPRPLEAKSAPLEEVTSAPSPPSSKRAPLKVDPLGPVNVSSEHIQMLTSESGPAECAKVITCNLPSSGGRSGKQQMTAAERAQASRDRNREHARNTRLRKKAYVEELKRTLMALAEQRDADLLRQEQATKIKEEQRKVRMLVLQEFLKMHGGNSQDFGRWAAILMPSFSLRTPTISNIDETVLDKTLIGVNQVVDNSRCFSGFLQTLGSVNASSIVTVHFDTTGSTLIMDGSTAVLDWEAMTVGAVNNGAKEEVRFHGNIKAEFDPESNKVVSAVMLFDMGGILSQKNWFASSH